MTNGSKDRRTIYVVDGLRTPFLKTRGVPGPFTAADLAVHSGRALLARQPFAPESLSEVIMGCVIGKPKEANIARIAALRMGCGNTVPAWTVQRNCASGMQALASAAQNIADGYSDLVLAGGTESMSHSPILFSDAMARWLGTFYGAKTPQAKLKALAQFRPHLLMPIIGLLQGLKDPVVGLSMGQTAEKQAAQFNITREQMDEFAARSQHRLGKAMEAGHYQNEILPIFDDRGKAYESDDGYRANTSLESLGKLKPVFDKPNGKVTAGNSSQVTDGAAMLLLASETAVKEHNLKPVAKIVDWHWAGLDPTVMGFGPIHAATPLMQRHNLGINDIDCWEINEAFAAQVLACIAAWQDDGYCQQELGLPGAFGKLDEDRLNIDGGSVAMGHPLGASGARLVLHLVNVLQREGGKRGMASLCIGGGQGGAMLIETV